MDGMTAKLSLVEPEPNGNGDIDASDGHALFHAAPQSVSFRKLRKRLIREVRETLSRYAMVEPGTRWLVGLSGGKDSYTLLALLLDLKWRGLLPVDLLACNLDQVQPGFPAHILPDFLGRYGIAHRIERQDTYSVVTAKVPEGQTYCALCSRLRRGHLYRIAREEGCSALVLGHHREDALETLLMNMMHGSRMAAMPAKLTNDAGDVQVLRPMIWCSESDIARFADQMAFPIIPCDLCGSQDGLERARIKAMLDEWEMARPGTKQNMVRSLANVRPSHLLDPKLYDFTR